MLNISRQIYTAIDTKQTKYDLPEAEVLPGGDTANEKKRLQKVTTKYGAVTEYDNKPLPGFTLYKTDRKNWGSLDQTWLVIDPRGFLVRITPDNLEKILHVTGITEGLIQQKCVWAREDSQTKLTLVPVSSSSYQEAVDNTELLEGKVDIKEVGLGDTVIMQNGLSGIYRGVLSLYGTIEDYSSTDVHKPQVYMRRQIVEISPGKFFYQTNAKILKVTKEAEKPMTREESAAYINSTIATGTAFFGTNPYSMSHGKYYHSRHKVCFVSTHAVPRPKMSLTEIDLTEATRLFHISEATGDSFSLILENALGKRFIVDFPYSTYSSSRVTVNGFDACPVMLNAEGDGIKQLGKRTYSGSGSRRAEALDKYTKFYKITKHVKNDSYV
jgi:hypothetical protein